MAGSLPRHLLAALAVGLATALLWAVPGADHLANVPLLYLLVVFLTALRAGRGPAITASVLAFLSFDWFFVAPRYTFTVSDPAEWLALFVFLVVAIVTGHLTALVGSQAEEARRREREAAALADASWAIASQHDRTAALGEVLRRLADVVEPRRAAILAPGDEPEVLATWGDGPADDLGPVRDLLRAPPTPTRWDGLPGDPSRILAPLATDGATLGVLDVRLPPGRALTPQERRAAASLANHAAVLLERDRLTRAEMQARALAEADRLKTALLAMVSHDFRSPLASIKASATTLLAEGGPVDRDTQEELLRGVDQEADRLNAMVGNILALSRLEADAWRPQCEAIPAGELIGIARQGLAREQNERIRVDLTAAPPEVWADPVQLGQVLFNLLDNALKYSPAGTPVEARISTGPGGEAVIEVLDRGPGLREGEEERVFERFYRSPELRESAVPGVGIGLAVCRGLVEAHGGALNAAPREGGGAVFRLTLPPREGPPR